MASNVGLSETYDGYGSGYQIRPIANLGDW